MTTDSGRRFHEAEAVKTENVHRAPEWNTGKEIQIKVTEILRKTSVKVAGLRKAAAMVSGLRKASGEVTGLRKSSAKVPGLRTFLRTEPSKVPSCSRGYTRHQVLPRLRG